LEILRVREDLKGLPSEGMYKAKLNFCRGGEGG